jgi:hypothetical protein
MEHFQMIMLLLESQIQMLHLEVATIEVILIKGGKPVTKHSCYELIKSSLYKALALALRPKTTFEEDRAIREKELERERERQKEQEQLLPSVVLERDLCAEKRREFDRCINELALIQSQISEQRARQEEQQLKQLRRRSVAEGGLCFKAAPCRSLSPTPSHLWKRTRTMTGMRSRERDRHFIARSLRGNRLVS